ncbi:caspase family protein [Sulfuritalea hydrogenivorans]|uniref:caspase family protein n=1 Tax=Sulfuritalea hydrogenivorans TaxID=748811 RepID=UPI0014942C4A|nr:caspase domain-containing protein [Sulfuritalea hydrogenivorans]
MQRMFRRWIANSCLVLLLMPLLAWAAGERTLGVTGTATGSSEKRVALVIGNSAYKTAPLANPVNDARAMAGKLRALGFEVHAYENLTQREMNRATTKFGESLASGSVGLLFYAGHGMQVKGRNFLIPIDAEIRTEASVRNEAVDAEQVMEQMDAAKTGLNIVILDACRNNPFERRFRGSSGGLASMDAPKGTLIAYATGPGKVASDGDGANGLYTSEILKVIEEPGLRIEDVFKRVRLNVARATNDEQLPWETSSLVGDFYFKPGQALPAAPSGAPSPATVEIEAMEEEMQVVSAAPVSRAMDGQGRQAALKVGDWVRVTGRIASLSRYRVALDKGVGYVPMSALEAPWFRKIGRLYKGVIGNNVRQPDAVVTRFDFMNGKLFGTYTIVEPGGKTDGTLEDFRALGPGKGSFKWKDPYGSGTLDVEFKGDLAAFSGTWKVKDMPDQGGNWSGARQ